MASHTRHHLFLSAAVACALVLTGTVVALPAVASTPGVTTSLPARTTSVPRAEQVSGSGQAVVWRQTTSADTLPHGWLSVAGGAPQDLGVLADTDEGVSVDAVSVQDSVVAIATSTNPNGALADHVTLRHLGTNAQETLAVAYDGSGAPGDERYRAQAGDGILVQQAYRNDDSAHRVRLVLRTSDGDRTLLSDDEQYTVLASDADGALVLRRTAPGWGYRIVYVDFATGTTATVAEPSTGELPQGLEFTPSHFGVIDGATLTEWQRSAPGGSPATVALPTDKARWISDDTLAWYAWSADGNELYAMSRDGSTTTAAADLGGTFADISVGDDGRMRASLYRPDVDAAIQTLADGRVSTAAGDATTIPAGPARLDALSLSGGTLYTADDSSRATGVLLSSTLTVGTSGASATTPSRVLAYSTGTVHQTLAAAGRRVLVEQGEAYQVYDNGTPTGIPLQLTGTSIDRVTDFDGSRLLLSDRTTTNNGTLLLYTVATGASARVPGGSVLDGGALYSSVKDGISSWSVRRADLTTGTTTTVATVDDCPPQGLQVRGSWILVTACGVASTQGLLLKTGTTTRTTVDASVLAPVLGTNVLYTYTKDAASGITLNAQVLGVTGATARALFAIPSRANSGAPERWAVDREAPWAAWMDGAGVTHVVWAGSPSRTSATASVPAGFSPNGDGSSDAWAPTWTYNRPVAWTLTLKSGSTSVRTLTGTAPGGKVAPVWKGENNAGTAAAQGAYGWTLAVKDTVTGEPAAAAGGNVALRRTVPAASVTSPALASDASNSAVIPVSWAAKTAGVTSYDIGWRVATRSSTGVWKLGPLQAWRNRTTAKSAVFGASGSPARPTPGLTYRFYARAHDDAGQTGAWSAASATGVPADDRSSVLSYKGTWTSASVTSAWAKTERVSATAGATVSFTADGTKLLIVAARKPNGGRFAVIVDGATVGTVNLYASTTGYRKVVFAYTLGTRIATHTAQLKVLSGSAAGRSTVNLDAVMVTR